MKNRKAFSRRCTVRRILPLAASIAALLKIGASANAAIYYWDTANGTWGTGANWSDNPASGGTTGVVPGSGDTAVFNQSSVNGNETVQLAADLSILGITFANTGTTTITSDSATPRALTIGTGGITINSGAGAVTIGDVTNIAAITLNGAQLWSNNSSSLFTVVNNVTNGSNLLTLAGTGDTAISGVIGSGSGGLTKIGTGTLTLSNNNTFTGAVTVAGGTLVAKDDAGALGAAGATLALAGGNLEFSKAAGGGLTFTRAGAISITSTSTLTSDVDSGGAGQTFTLGGAFALGAQQLNIRAGGTVTSGTASVSLTGTTTLSVNGTTIDVGSNANLTTGAIAGNFNVIKQGAGTWTANNTSTRASSATYLNAGTILQTNVAGLGAATVTLTLNGGTLDLATDASTNAYPTTLLGSSTVVSNSLAGGAGAGVPHVLGTFTSLGANTLTVNKGGNVTSGTAGLQFGVATINAATTFNVATGAKLTFSSTLTETGNGTITTSGGGDATFTGIIAGGGGLSIGNSGTTTLTAGNTFTGPVSISAGNVTLGNVAGLGAVGTAVVTMTNSAGLNLAAVGSTMLSLSGGVSNTISSSGAATLTVSPVANSTSVFAGNIGGGGGTLAVTVGNTNNGGGALTLSGNNSYTGITTLAAGRLNINSNTALGSNATATALTITTGMIDNTSAGDVALTNNTPATLNGNFTYGGSGNLSFGSGTLLTTASRTLTLMGTANKTLTFGTWNNNFATSSTTVLAMPGSNSTVNFGNFKSTSTATVATILGNGNITINAGITPGASGGTVVFSSAGTLTLSGASSANLTGMTFNSGNVILDATGGTATLSSSLIPTFGGGTFFFKGNNSATGQTLGNVTLNAGASTLKVQGGSSGTTLTLGSLTDATNGSMLNIVLSGTTPVVTSTTAANNGIIGAVATRAGITVTNTSGYTGFATNTGAGTAITALSGQPNAVTASVAAMPTNTVNYLITDTGTVTTSANLVPQTLQISSAGAGILSLTGTNTLAIKSGGLLYTGSGGYEISRASTGTVSSGTTVGDLIIHNFGSGGFTISAPIVNGAGASVVSIDGTGTTTLSGVNTYTGATLVGGGATLAISANSGLGADGATALTLNNATLQTTGTFGLNGASNRTVTLGPGGGTFNVTGSSDVLTVLGVISSTGSLTKTGSGTLLLSTGVNTYSGGFTNVQAGTLQLGGAAGSIAATNIVVLGSGSNAGTLVLGDASNAKSQTVAGLLDVNTSGTSVVKAGGNASNSTLTYTGSLAVPTTFTGTIGGGGSNEDKLALVVTNGALTLTGNNTYSGGTTLQTTVPVLNIGSNTAIGSGTLALNIAAAVIDATGGNRTMTNNNNVTTNAGFVFAGSNDLSFGTGTLGVSVTAKTIALDGAKTLTFGSLINTVPTAAAFALTVNGVSGSSLSLGGYTLQSDNAAIAGFTSTLNGSGNINITGAIINGNGQPNALSYTGTGVLTLSAANSYTGLTTLNNAGGTLKFATTNNSLNSGAGNLTLTAGVIDLGGTTQNVGTLTATAGLITSSAASGSITGTITGTTNAANWSGTLAANLTATAAATITGSFYNTGNLSFTNSSSGAYTLSGAPIQNTGNIGFAANNSGAFTVSAALINPAGIITNSGSGSGTTTISGVVGSAVTGITQSSAASGSPLIVSGAISVNSTLLTITQSGGGPLLTISGAQFGTGNVRVVDSSTAGGNVTYSGTAQFAGNLELQSTATTGTPGIITVSALNNVGTVTNNGSGNANNVISGAIGASVTGVTQNSASSALTLSGGNSSFLGGVTLTNGTLNLNSATALGGTASAFTINGGVIDQTVASVTLTPNNPITIGANFTYGGTNNLNLGTGAITNAADRTITLNGSGKTLTMGGVMTNSKGSLQTTTVNGAGNTLSIGGYVLSDSATSYTDVINGSGNATITGTVSNGSSTASGLTYSGTGAFTASGGFNTNGGTQTLTLNSGSNAVNLSGALTGAAGTLVLAGSGTNVTVGALTGSANAVTINSTTGGIYTFNGANSFTGQLTVQSGTMSIATINNVSANGTLGNNALSVILGGSGGQTGTLQYTAASGSTTKGFTFAAGGIGEINLTGAALTISGLLDGTGTLLKTGVGALTLSGGTSQNNNIGSTSQFSGMTKVTGGTIVLPQIGGGGSVNAWAVSLWKSPFDTTGSGSGVGISLSTASTTLVLGGLAGNVDIANAITSNWGTTPLLVLNPQSGSSVSYSGVISNGALGMALQKVGSGTQILTNANTYSGATTVGAGTLALAGASGTAQNSAFTVLGGTLLLDNTTALADRLNNTTALSLGSLTLKAKVGAGNQSETVGDTNFATSGKVTVDLNGGTDQTTLALGAVTRSVGAAIDFVGVGGTLGGGANSPNVTSSGVGLPANTNGILPWATVGGTEWAENNSNSIRAYSGSFNTDLTTATNSQNARTTGSLSLSGAAVANSLNIITSGSGQSLNLGGNSLTLGSAAASPGAILKSGTDAYTISGTGLIYAGSAGAGTELIVHVDGGDLTISAPLNTAIVGIAKGGTGNLILSGARNTTLAVNAGFTGNIGIAGGILEFQGASTTISGVISGSGGLTVNLNPGQVMYLSNNSNSYTGKTLIKGGVLKVDFNQVGIPGGVETWFNYGNTSLAGSNVEINGGVLFSNYGFGRSLGAGPDQVQITGGTSGFSYGGTPSFNLDYGRELVWGSTYFQPDVLVLNESNATKAMALTNGFDLNGASRNIMVDNANFGTTLSGIIRTSSGTAGLTKTGIGTLILSGANSFNGETAVNVGVLNIQNATALGSIAGGVTVTSGAALQIQGNLAIGAEALTLNGTGFNINDGALRNISGTSTYGGLVTLGSSTRINADAGSLTLSNVGTITGAGFDLYLGGGAGNIAINSNIATTNGNLTKDGTGTLTLTGTNTYTGNTFVRSGTLQVTNQVSLYNNGTAATWSNTNIKVESGATMAFNVGGAGQFTAANINTILGLSNSTTNGFNTGSILGIDTSGGGITYSNVIANPNSGTNVLSLTKLGTNTLTLDQSNTYTGGTLISAGTLQIGNGSTTGSLSTNSQIQNNGTLTINRSNPVAQGTDFSGASIVGTGTLVQAGSGTTTLNAANTFSGTTTVNAGTLTLANQLALQNSALVTTSGTSTIGGGITTALTLGGLSGASGDLGSASVLSGYTASSIATLTLNTAVAGPFTYGGVISDTSTAVTLIKSGTGTQILSSASNTYTGTTIVSGGTLQITGRINGTTGTALAFGGTSLFNVNEAASSAQHMTSLAFNVGDGTVQSTFNATSANLTFDATPTRSAGAGTGIFIVSGGAIGTAATNANGTLGTNNIIITGQTGQAPMGVAYFVGTASGNNYAFYDGAGFVRPLDYTKDAIPASAATFTGAQTSLASGGYVQLQSGGSVSGQLDGTSFTGLHIINSANSAQAFTLASGATVTVNGILRTGNGGASSTTTISGGTLQAANNAEMVIRTDLANDLITITSTIQANGTNVLTKSGLGTLTLNGPNTFTGGLVINAGTVTTAAAASVSAGGTGTGSITVNSGGRFTLNSGVGTLTRAVTMNGGALFFAGSGSDLTLDGTIAFAANSTINTSNNNSGFAAITSTTSGAGGFTLTGAGGGLKLNGSSNTYTGATLVTGTSGLTVKQSLYGNDTSKWIPANITVTSGSTLMLNVQGTGEFTLAQANTMFSQLSANVNGNGLQAGATIGVDTRNAANGIYTYSSVITDSAGNGGGAVNFKHTGNANTTLELTGANTYSGTTIVDNNATLKVSSFNSVVTNPTLGTVHTASSSLGAPTSVTNGTIHLGSAGSPSNIGNTFNGGSLIYVGTGETTDRIISLNDGGGATYKIDQSGTGLLKFLSNFAMGDSRGNKTINLTGSNSGTGEIAGVIPTTTTGTMSVTKSGSSTWTLSGANLYTATTDVITGSLGIGNNAAFGTSTLNIGGTNANTPTIFAAGGARNISNTTVLLQTSLGGNPTISGSNDLTISGTITASGAARILSVNNSGLTTLSGSVFLSNDNTTSGRGLTINGTGNTLISGVIANNNAGNSLAATLTKAGTGTTTLSNINTYSGKTTVQAGTLSFSNERNLGTNASLDIGITSNSSVGTLFYTGGVGTLAKNINALGSGGNIIQNGSVSGLLTLSGTLAKNGTTLTLSGGSGGIAVTGAITGAAANSDLVVNSGTVTVSNNNTYNGPTTVSNNATLEVTGSLSGTTGVTVNTGGTLLLNSSSSDIVKTTATANLAGGTLAFGNAASQSQTFASLTLTANSTLDFGTGGSTGNDTFLFGAFTHTALTGGTLTINGWDGSLAGNGNDRLLFTGSIVAFQAAFDQSDISFNGYGVGYNAIQFGGNFEIVPVPEPATTALIGAVGLCALIGYRERRRFTSKGRAGSR